MIRDSGRRAAQTEDLVVVGRVDIRFAALKAGSTRQRRDLSTFHALSLHKYITKEVSVLFKNSTSEDEWVPVIRLRASEFCILSDGVSRRVLLRSQNKRRHSILRPRFTLFAPCLYEKSNIRSIRKSLFYPGGHPRYPRFRLRRAFSTSYKNSKTCIRFAVAYSISPMSIVSTFLYFASVIV